MKTHTFIDSPVGRLLLVVEGGALTAVYHEEHDPPPVPAAVGLPFAECGPGRGSPGTGAAPDSGASSTTWPAGAGAGSDGGKSDGAGSDGREAAGAALAGVSANEAKVAAAAFARAQTQFRAYFAGRRRTFTLPIHASGTEFQQGVWAALLDIPYGETRSYKDVAAQLGNASMGRAIGAAIRANPLAILVPGHRVISSTGAVTGYSAGPEAKKFLLALEAGDAPRSAAQPTQ